MLAGCFYSEELGLCYTAMPAPTAIPAFRPVPSPSPRRIRPIPSHVQSERALAGAGHLLISMSLVIAMLRECSPPLLAIVTWHVDDALGAILAAVLQVQLSSDFADFPAVYPIRVRSVKILCIALHEQHNGAHALPHDMQTVSEGITDQT